ncbi:hypothetical protein K1719_004038 [Acacia pycnantha]|nr:hypothetical protein K1719_004038 [Acacia pycnantha]
MSIGELACSYAVVLLHDDGIPITAEKISTVVKAANVDIESYWPSLFAKLAEKRDIEDLILNSEVVGLRFFVLGAQCRRQWWSCSRRCSRCRGEEGTNFSKDRVSLVSQITTPLAFGLESGGLETWTFGQNFRVFEGLEGSEPFDFFKSSGGDEFLSTFGFLVLAIVENKVLQA